MKNIVFENVKKAYGKNVVVEDLCMEVKEGERLILLGPSGCGKSTTLRMIAGLENVTAGNLWMRDQVVNDVPCGERGVSMVFQNYALFPHMSVKNNIIYGLKAHKMDENEIDARLKEVLKMLELEGLEDRKPKELSGGQRQRVALARAVVKRADVSLCYARPDRGDDGWRSDRAHVPGQDGNARYPVTRIQSSGKRVLCEVYRFAVHEYRGGGIS